jgi:hypothetical protein
MGNPSPESTLKILSSEMDLAERRLIRYVVIKERGVVVFYKNPPVPHPLGALYRSRAISSQ